MAGDDRLSTLSDDLLSRVLYFVPTKEAASTSVLSRRWGNLWRSSGAVNLVARIHDDSKPSRAGYYRCNFQQQLEAEEAFFSRRDAFVGNAEAALVYAEAPVTKLTIHVKAENPVSLSVIDRFLHSERGRRTNRDVVRALVRHRAARRVEELRVAATMAAGTFTLVGVYKLPSLPSSETLRVLDLTG